MRFERPTRVLMYLQKRLAVGRFALDPYVLRPRTVSLQQDRTWCIGRHTRLQLVMLLLMIMMVRLPQPMAFGRLGVSERCKRSLRSLQNLTCPGFRHTCLTMIGIHRLPSIGRHEHLAHMHECACCQGCWTYAGSKVGMHNCRHSPRVSQRVSPLATTLGSTNNIKLPPSRPPLMSRAATLWTAVRTSRAAFNHRHQVDDEHCNCITFCTGFRAIRVSCCCSTCTLSVQGWI